jgi:aryl-phospho-beta-D-glucosidase BglC (GH1 family)
VTAGSLQLSSATYSVAENAGSLVISVTRSGGSSGAVSVSYATANGTAASGTNYTASSGSLSWASADTSSKSITVPIVNASSMTSNATFTVALSAPSGGATLGSTSSTTVTITPVAPVTSSTFGVKVSGNHLVDENGNTVQLRGVNVSGLEFVAIGNWDPSNPWGSQTGTATPDWDTIKTWGTNAVRLPLNEASWLGLTCIDVGGYSGTAGATIKADPGANYQATVEQSVAQATAAGLYVILDLHWAAPNNASGTPLCPTVQNPMADTDHSIAFWTSVANQFKGNPAVVFELFNEPFLGNTSLVGNTPWPDLLNGGTVSTFVYTGGSGSMNLTWSTAGMQQLLDAVRGTGATNVVLSSTLSWAQQMDGWLQYKPTDPIGQLGAVWHPYPYTESEVACGPDGIITVGEPQCASLEMAAVQAIVAAGYPVVATEFGDTIGGSTAPWASILLPFADTNGVSYLGWVWDNWTATENLLITDAAGDPTQGYGTYVKAHYLCRAAGTANCP